MVRAAVLVAACAGWASPQPAAAQRQLRVRLVFEAPGLDAAGVELELARQAGEPRTLRLSRAPRTDPLATIALPPARWTIRCLGDVFCPPVEVDLGGADAEVTVHLFRSALVVGTLEARGAPLPEAIELQGRFAAIPLRELGFRVGVKVAKGRFETRLPSEPLDIRIDADPYAPVYLWSQTPRPPITQLGPLALSIGASVSGRVVEESSGDVVPGLQLQAVAAPGDPAVDTASRLQEQGTSTATDRRGFFQLRGLVAGRYDIEAISTAYQRPVRLASGVEVSEDTETSLDVLALRPPARLEVLVKVEGPPELRASASRWTARLRTAEQPPVTDWMGARPVDRYGHALFERIAPGRYVLSIQDRDGPRSTLASRELEILESLRVELELDLVEIRGVVKLGERPLAGTLVLHTQHGSGMTFATDEDGRFAGRVPRPKTKGLLARVQAENPAVHENKQVAIENPEADPIELEIVLDDYRISGSVVDEDGQPIEAASVSSSPVEVLTDASGAFELAGLEGGRRSVTAAQGGYADAPAQQVTLSRDQPTAQLRFVLSRGRRVEVLLADEAGRGLPGVKFYLDWLGFAGHRDYETDPRGRARVILPGGARLGHLRILSAGHPPWATCLSAPSEREGMVVRIPTRGSGQLRGQKVFSGGDSRGASLLRLLFHSGGALQVGELRELGRLAETLSRDGQSFVLSGLASGSYAVVDTQLSLAELTSASCAGSLARLSWTAVSGGETAVIEPQRLAGQTNAK